MTHNRNQTEEFVKDLSVNFSALYDLLNLAEQIFEKKNDVYMVTDESSPETLEQANRVLQQERELQFILPAVSLLKRQLNQQINELEEMHLLRMILHGVKHEGAK